MTTRLLRPTDREDIAQRLLHPDCYARVGLDPKQASRAARHNPHWRASKAWFARQAVETFTAAGLVSGTSVYIWRMAGLIGPPTPGDRPGGRHDA